MSSNFNEQLDRVINVINHIEKFESPITLII